MKVKEFFDNNSLHDSYIISSGYISEEHILKINIVQLYSELTIKNETSIELGPDDQVELELLFKGIIHLGSDMNEVEAFEITGSGSGKINNYDIIMFQMYDEKQKYREAYIRGQNIEVKIKIIGKV